MTTAQLKLSPILSFQIDARDMLIINSLSTMLRHLAILLVLRLSTFVSSKLVMQRLCASSVITSFSISLHSSLAKDVDARAAVRSSIDTEGFERMSRYHCESESFSKLVDLPHAQLRLG